MRYWKFKESTRVIAVDCQMSYRWEEVTEEVYLDYIHSLLGLSKVEKVV